jgi:hypothetical protein
MVGGIAAILLGLRHAAAFFISCVLEIWRGLAALCLPCDGAVGQKRKKKGKAADSSSDTAQKSSSKTAEN